MPDIRLADVAGGVPVVAAPEEIDITNAAELRAALLEAVSQAHQAAVVDMTRTRFCDSVGLQALVAAHRLALGLGREVLLVIPSVAVLRILAITGLDRLIPNFPTLTDALSQVDGSPAAGAVTGARAEYVPLGSGPVPTAHSTG